MNILKRFETLTDEELVNRIRAGETELFEILIRRNNPYLYKIGRSYGFNHQDVEDLMQETFISTFMNLQKFEFRSSLKTWITRIMINQCYQRSQRSSFKNEIAMDNIFNDTTVPMFHNNERSDSLKTVTSRELKHTIEDALMQIPMDYRMVFSLRELNGMNTAETAEALNISETNVKVRLNRAKQMIREKVEKMYSPEDIFEFNLIYCDRIVDKVMAAINKI